MLGRGTIVGFEKFTEFENALSAYTGAPYVVLTDCCTHAVELCLRLQKTGTVTLPYRSYISIPMTMHKLKIEYYYDKVEWDYEYRIGYLQSSGRSSADILVKHRKLFMLATIINQALKTARKDSTCSLTIS